jgi:hypothetical protein
LASKYTVLSRSCDHTDFLATEFRAIYQRRNSGFPLLWIWTNIIERDLEDLGPDFVIRTKDATGLDESPPRHFNTLARTGKSEPARLNPQFTLALQGLALYVCDFAWATVKDSALQNVCIQMRPDASVYRI